MSQRVEKSRTAIRTGNGEEGYFARFLGATPKNLVMEFFLIGRRFDWTASDVSNQIEANGYSLSKVSVYNVIKELLDEGVISETRVSSGAQRYQLNHEATPGRAILEAYKAMVQTAVTS